MPIEKADRKDLEKKYDLTLEKSGYVDVEEKDYTVRILKRNQKIDTYEVFEGKDVVDDDEIVVSKGFAQANDLAIGDKLKLDGKQYTSPASCSDPTNITAWKTSPTPIGQRGLRCGGSVRRDLRRS